LAVTVIALIVAVGLFRAERRGAQTSSDAVASDSVALETSDEGQTWAEDLQLEGFDRVSKTTDKGLVRLKRIRAKRHRGD
jgi:hypothetical protein